MREMPSLGRWVRIHLKRSPRYVIVAAFCAVIYNVVMISMDRAGFHYAVSQAISAAILLPLGYMLQGDITFAAHRSWRGFVKYSAALLTNYPVAIIALWVLCDVLHLDMTWAAPISMVILFAWNYLASAWAFAGQSDPALREKRG